MEENKVKIYKELQEKKSLINSKLTEHDEQLETMQKEFAKVLQEQYVKFECSAEGSLVKLELAKAGVEIYSRNNTIMFSCSFPVYVASNTDESRDVLNVLSIYNDLVSNNDAGKALANKIKKFWKELEVVAADNNILEMKKELYDLENKIEFIGQQMKASEMAEQEYYEVCYNIRIKDGIKNKTTRFRGTNRLKFGTIIKIVGLSKRKVNFNITTLNNGINKSYSNIHIKWIKYMIDHSYLKPMLAEDALAKALEFAVDN
jgi:hypothetical protein